MKTFLVLTLTLLVDLAMAEVEMCEMADLAAGTVENPTSTPLVVNYPENNYIYVGFQACQGARLTIAKIFGLTTYRVHFGEANNTLYTVSLLTYATISETVVFSKAEESPLDCNEMRYFWVKVIDGEITFGKGLQVGSDEIGTVTSNYILGAHLGTDSTLDSEGNYPVKIELQCDSAI
ncbi:hypothetical protein CAPTEDRAFT_201760 [Capitella teleta]|uniref:Farnesoic acid O-methyl transferase domain-containing protein n=1 Tax=Capitella teleta TaxID=283909 RepID=R7T4P8_CAPTE|nr:hypothetical protein CAPTEDRAFT_201760 [Capitella teleta]|eukprot:ELT87831.1 hypothetical protein CAPTEDRAFT_201760 [Capitella teleta]